MLLTIATIIVVCHFKRNY